MKNTSVWFWSWLSLSLATFCASGQAARNTNTMTETLPAYAITNYIDLLNSTNCKSDLGQFRAAVDRNELWGLRMLDASGQPQSGFVNGNNYWMGDKLQCDFIGLNKTLELSEEVLRNNSIYRDPNDEFVPFQLHFYVANMAHNGTIQYHVEVRDEDMAILGLCLPASCTKSEVATLVNQMLRDEVLLIGKLFAVRFTLLDVSDMKDDHEWMLNWKMIAIIIIFFSLSFIVVMGTAYDVMIYQKRLRKKKEFLAYENNNTCELKNDAEEKREADHEEITISELKPQNRMEQILVCFSLYTSMQQIFYVSGNGDGIPIFHALKFFSMAWIVLVHTTFYGRAFIANKPLIYDMGRGFVAQIVSNATFSVDTYFFISGFLLTFVFLKGQQKEKRSMNLKEKTNMFVMVIVKRYFRITPAYLTLVLASILNFSWHKKTSVFTIFEHESKPCVDYWWRNMLYINNLFSWEDMCLNWTWYLANDMQFFIFGSFLLILSITQFKIAAGLGIIAFIGSITMNGYSTYTLNYIPTLDKEFKLLSFLYVRPWLRIPPYLVGMATAHLLSKWNYKLHLSKKALTVCWMLGILCNCSILFAPADPYLPLSVAILYTGFNRAIWGIGIAWLTVACCTNNGGIVNKFLSLPTWTPLGRLTYCSYLLNPFIIFSVFLYRSYAVEGDFLLIGALFLGFTTITYICSILLSAAVEVPFIQLMRIIISNNRMK